MKKTVSGTMLALVLMGIMTAVVSAQVGVEAGNWIKYGEISITGTGVPSQYNVEWIKMEITGIQGNTVSVTATSHPTTGSETTQTLSGDVSTGTGTLSFFLIPANLTKGDSVPIMGMGMLTVTDVVTRTYAGASRSTVYVEYGVAGAASMKFYWDQATGVMTEMRMEVTTPTTYTMTMKATDSNMWQAGPAAFAIDPTYLYILAAVIVVIAVVTIAFVMRRKKPPEAVTPPPSPPSIQP